MTHRQAVTAALRFQRPFPVPYQVGFTHLMHQRMVAYTGDPNYADAIDNAIAAAYLTKPETEVSSGLFRDEFGVVWDRRETDQDIGNVHQFLLQDKSDLDRYELPLVDEAFVRHSMQRLMDTAGDQFRVAAIGFSLFERAWTLRGMENLLCDMVEEPAFVHELLDRITKRNLAIIRIALQYDIDCFHFGDDWGQQKGLIMGPTHWRTFLKPCLARMYGAVREAGKFVSQHSCGDIRDVMDDLHDIGLNMYQTFQPEIYGLAYAQRLRNRITIWGGISTQQDLPRRTPDEIRAITRELLRAFPEGGLVASPTHDIPGDVPPENVLAMLDVLDHQVRETEPRA